MSKSADFYAVFGILGGGCGTEKGYAFWSLSMDFYALFGRLGEDCSTQKGHAFWSKSVDFYAFLGFLGKGAALKKGVHFEAKVWRHSGFVCLVSSLAILSPHCVKTQRLCLFGLFSCHSLPHCVKAQRL